MLALGADFDASPMARVTAIHRFPRSSRARSLITLDLAANRLILADGTLDYDFLIIATGATHAYFGHDEWRRVAPGLKTLEDALGIRRRVLIAFERAERETDPARRTAELTFALVDPEAA